MKKKVKTTWRVFSAKRRVTVESLISAGKFSDYSGYVNYCDTYTVLPMSADEFNKSLPVATVVALVEPDIANSEHTLVTADKESDSHLPSSEGLEATVWLAGVKDSPEEVKIEEKKTSKKSKKENIQD